MEESVNDVFKEFQNKSIAKEKKVLRIEKSEDVHLLNNLPEDLEELYVGFITLRSFNTFPKNLKVLDFSINAVEKLPDLPDSLEELYCGGNEFKELPKLPKNLIRLNCVGNQLTKLPKLPESLVWLHCSRNKLTKLPKLPSKLSYLDCSKNQLTTLPTLKNIHIVNAENNKIKTIPKVTGVRDLFLNGNNIESIPESLKGSSVNIALFDNPIAKDLYHVSQTDLNLIQYRTYDDNKFSIITFKKGTVLFRKHHSIALIAEDFIGKPLEDKYYLSPDHLVWYSLSPFEKYFGSITSINVLQNDVHLILGVLPSNDFGGNIIMHNPTKFQTDCDKKKNIRKVDQKGYKCFKDDFIEQNPDIMGSLQIYDGKVDDRTLFRYDDKFVLTYETFYQDVAKNTNIPEVVLYPRKIRDRADRILPKEDFTQTWFEKHIDEFNVKPIHVFTNEGTFETMKLDKYKNIIDQFLSPDGFKIDEKAYHMTINKKNRDYVIAEFADPELLKLCLPIEDNDKQKFLKL
jgi:hypothetical protein